MSLNRFNHYMREIKKHMDRLIDLEASEKGPRYRRSRKIHQDAIKGFSTRVKLLGRVAPIIYIKGTTFQKFGTVNIQKPIEIYFSNCSEDEAKLILEHDYKGVVIEHLEVIIPGETRILNNEQ